MCLAPAAKEGGGRLTAGKLYDSCLAAKPPAAGWFSLEDVCRRLARVLLLFYRCLLTEPLQLLSFTWAWNLLWYGRILGALFTLALPVAPVLIVTIELVHTATHANASMLLLCCYLYCHWLPLSDSTAANCRWAQPVPHCSFHLIS